MSDVKRYAFDEGFLDRAEDGDYVLASDYDALSARCEELERRLAGAWCVRELEWTKYSTSTFYADTTFGRVCVRQQPFDGKWWADCHFYTSDLHDSLDAAKAAAQAWFNEKMTAGLRRAGG